MMVVGGIVVSLCVLFVCEDIIMDAKMCDEWLCIE